MVLKFLVVVFVIGVAANPFDEADKYVANFENGLHEVKKVYQNYIYREHDFDHHLYNEKQANLDAEEFDFIIVGSGPSGAALASRLSEVPEWKILVLEAGAPETLSTQVPSMHQYLQNTPYNWHYTSIPQKTSCLGLQEHRCHISQGKALGGSSSINDMLYTRGNTRDYDLWSDLGNEGWCHNTAIPILKSIEDAFIEHHDRKQHKYGGPVHIENPQYSEHLLPHFLKACEELHIKETDYNGKDQLGLSIPQLTTKNGERLSMAKAYLEPAVKRKNLVVRPLSQVTKILISEHTKEAVGVKYVHADKLFVAKASKEVIIAAGPINTPQLLKLSGIGPKEELEKHEIPVVADLHVGYNLKDHPAFIGLNFVFNESIPEGHDIHDAIVKYLRHGKGPLSSTGLEGVGFVKTELSKNKFDYPDIEFLITSTLPNKGIEDIIRWGVTEEIYKSVWKPLEGHKGFSIIPIVLHPKSVGAVKLHDRDPLHHPLIDLNQLSDEEDHDIDTMLAGIHLALKLVHTDAIQDLGVHLNHHEIPGCDKYEFASDLYWKCAIRHLTVSFGDLSGTARMGPDTDKLAVVDKTLKVYGVHNLRVADASVIPVTISGNLLAPSVIIGERAAELIKKDWY